jgi:hypothetical protein
MTRDPDWAPLPNIRHGGTDRTYRCQWPGCGDIAGHTAQRGIEMPRLQLCNHHLEPFRALSDVEAFEVSRRRQARRTYYTAKGIGYAWLDGEKG